jgi:hypothetical protein
LRRRKIWADDIFAFFALIAVVIQIVATFLHCVPLPNNLSHVTRVAAYYLMAHTFYLVIWLALLCILPLTFYSLKMHAFSTKKGHPEWLFSSVLSESILSNQGDVHSPLSLGYSSLFSLFSWRRSSGSANLNQSGRARGTLSACFLAKSRFPSSLVSLLYLL